MIALSPSVPPGKHLLECSYTTRKPHSQIQHHDPLEWPLPWLYIRGIQGTPTPDKKAPKNSKKNWSMPFLSQAISTRPILRARFRLVASDSESGLRFHSRSWYIGGGSGQDVTRSSREFARTMPGSSMKAPEISTGPKMRSATKGLMLRRPVQHDTPGTVICSASPG